MSPSDMLPANFDEQKGKTVCVMDASGQVGSALVKKLLQRGYTVHAAVQTKGNQSHLDGVSSQNQNLKIFEADPFDYQSIVDALKNCSGFELETWVKRGGVLNHSTSMLVGLFYNFEPPRDQLVCDEFMAEVEVRAAHNVLEACAQTESIDKVVFTSSVTSVIWRDDRTTMQADLDERHWTDVNFCRKFKLWYAMSKSLSEKAAWALAMDRGVNMVTVNGGLLMGPELSIKNPYLKGAAEMYDDGVFVTVDLDFLVNAHICVFEDISSYGRYLCFNHVISRHEDAVKLAQMLTPEAPSLPPSNDVKIIQQRISNKKLNKLMVDFVTGSLVN